MRQLVPLSCLLLALALTSTGASAGCPSHPADVAPGVLGSEVPTPTWTAMGDGTIDVQDVLALLNQAVSRFNIVWQPPVDAGCVALPGNIAPGDEDGGFAPPRWTPAPNDAVDVADVLIVLRMAVGLVRLDPAWLEPIVSDGQVGDRVVAGSVIDSVNSLGLSSVVVTAILDESPVGQTETDAQGKFLLQGLPSGPLQLRVDGSSSTSGGKFSAIQVTITVDTSATTSLPPVTLADETDPAGASGKFIGDESGTVDDPVDLSSGDGDVGLQTGPGGKILVDGEPADGEVDLSVVPLGGEDLPDELTDPDTDESLNSTGEVAVGPAGGKFTAGGSGVTLGADGTDPGFDLILPNRDGLPLGTVVDIWHWDGGAWVNCSTATGRTGSVVELSPGGMTAVRADGVATEGGLYAAALPADLGCVSTLSGRVVDGSGAPLAGVFVTTSLGATGFTDDFGNFFIENVPAYTGGGLLPCTAIGYEVYVRGGLDLGGETASTTVDAISVTPGFDTNVGDLTLSVPDEGCLSGLVLVNGVGTPGPVTITGPDSGVLVADDEGRFFAPSLPPGQYRAAYLFAGEDLPREYEFEIIARLCTTVRIARNAGGGSQRLTLDVLFDDDDDFLTPNPPVAGALVRLIGSDPISSEGLEAVTGPSGRLVFEGVTPPYEIVTVLERPYPADVGSAGAGSEGTGAIMRMGSRLRSSAPGGQAATLLRLPLSVDGGDEYLPDGDVFGTVSNLPVLGPDEFFQAAGLPRGIYQGLLGGFVDPMLGDYACGGYSDPFDIALTRALSTWPYSTRELVLFGPFELPPPAMPELPPVLFQDLDWSAGDRLLFDQALPVTYTNFLTPANFKEVAISGRRADGRSFWSLSDLLDDSTPFPSSVMVPSPASTDLSLALEFISEAYDPGTPEQITVMPLPNPLPASLVVPFSLTGGFTGPAGPSLTLSEARMTPVTYTASDNVSARGFDIVAYEWQTFDVVAPGGLAASSFLELLPPGNAGQAVLGDTPLPFVFPDSTLEITLDSFRSDAFPATFDQLFGPGLGTIFTNLIDQGFPICLNSGWREYAITPDLP